MIKVLPSAENFSAVWVSNFCLWVTSLALLRMGKSWLQQLLAKAGAQCVSQALLRQFSVWMQKELLLLQLSCGLCPSAVISPFPESWAMLQSLLCNSMTISAVFCWVPWGETSHLCASPDSLHLGLQTDEAICCPAELLQAPHTAAGGAVGKPVQHQPSSPGWPHRVWIPAMEEHQKEGTDEQREAGQLQM